MDLRCPGRDSNAGLDSMVVECPSCRREVELFGDEQKLHCRCGQWVFREALPSCARWCKAAKRCLGEIGDFAQLLQDVQEAPDQKEQEERLRRLQEQIARARENCALPESEQQGKQSRPRPEGAAE